jgi:hypothetical protein|tara:strand:- start:138 stop:698 length:561 start_codon:yes stop_codon:yes gene_type:complete
MDNPQLRNVAPLTNPNLSYRAESIKHKIMIGPREPAPTVFTATHNFSSVPMWKIRSIAKFKRLQYSKKKDSIQNDCDSTDNSTANESSAGTSDGKNGHILRLPEPMIGISPNTVLLQSISDEQIHTEFDSLNRNTSLIKREMSALENIRSQLFWLLEKGTLFETQRNHSENIDKEARNLKKQRIYT